MSNELATLKGFLTGDQFRSQIAMSLPTHLTPDRFVRVAQTALSRVPRLAECDQPSFFKCLLDLSAMGLEPDGRRAHLIPFRNNKTNRTECQLIVDYKGIVELVRRSGEVRDIHADVVCENDEFEYSYGSGGKLVHKPTLEERGKAIAAYSYVTLKDGSESYEVLNAEDIESVRKRSKAGNNGPWKTDWREMAKKTAFRRHSKWLPISVELRDKIEKDDSQFVFESQLAPKRARVSPLSNVPELPYEPDSAAPPQNGQDAPEAEQGDDVEFLSAISDEFSQMANIKDVQERRDVFCHPDSDDYLTDPELRHKVLDLSEQAISRIRQEKGIGEKSDKLFEKGNQSATEA